MVRNVCTNQDKANYKVFFVENTAMYMIQIEEMVSCYVIKIYEFIYYLHNIYYLD
jgi:hypothetical protein